MLNDIKVIGTASIGYGASAWDALEPVLQGMIVTATVIYVVIRAYKEIISLVEKKASSD